MALQQVVHNFANVQLLLTSLTENKPFSREAFVQTRKRKTKVKKETLCLLVPVVSKGGIVSLCWVRNAELKSGNHLCCCVNFGNLLTSLCCECVCVGSIGPLCPSLCSLIWKMNEESKRNVCINSVHLPGYSLSAGLDSEARVVLGVSADDAFSVNMPSKCRLNFLFFYSLKLGLFCSFFCLFNEQL